MRSAGGGDAKRLDHDFRTQVHVRLGEQRLLHLQRERQGVGEDVAKAAKRFVAGEKFVQLLERAAVAGEAGQHGVRQLLAQRLQARQLRGHHIRDEFGPGHAVEPIRGEFFGEADPGEAAQAEVEAAVRQLLMPADAAEARHRFDLRLRVVLVLPTRLQHHQRNELVAFQRIGEQLAVARLEDVQPLHHVREEHEVRQREEPYLTVEGGECGKVVVHGGSRRAITGRSPAKPRSTSAQNFATSSPKYSGRYGSI